METFVDGRYSNDLLIHYPREKRRTPTGLQAHCAVGARKCQFAHIRNDDFECERMGEKLQGGSRVETFRSYVGHPLAGNLETPASPRTRQLRGEAASQLPKAN